MEDNSLYKGTFLSVGDVGYRAPCPRKPDIKEIVQHMRQCRDELTRNVIILQQAALEQERVEAFYEQLARGAEVLINVAEELSEGETVTGEWEGRRDEAIKTIHMIIGKARRSDMQEER